MFLNKNVKLFLLPNSFTHIADRSRSASLEMSAAFQVQGQGAGQQVKVDPRALTYYVKPAVAVVTLRQPFSRPSSAGSSDGFMAF